MSPRTTALPDVVAATPGGDITQDMIAGYYVPFSLPEQGVPLARARKAFKDNGLDPDRLPKERRPEHVMQDACTAAQKISQNGHREEIRAQQVGRTKDFLIYQMTRHVHDLANRVIEHPKALRVLFSFDDGTLSFDQLDGADEHVLAIQGEIQDYFDSHQSQLPGRGLRTHVRHYLEAAGAEWIRDGFYFLPATMKLGSKSPLRDFHGDSIDAKAFIESFKASLDAIYGKRTPFLFHEIECINNEGQRAFLKRRFVENCSTELKSYRDELLALVTGKDDRERSFRADKRANLVEKRKQIDERRAQFAEVLGETLSELDRDMKLADQALAKFLTTADA